jgi:transcriptional regulator with GAF, ATPase, and Fis domain
MTLSSELAAVATDLHRGSDVEGTMQSVLHHARALTGGDAAAVMIKQGRRTDVVSSSPEAEQADLAQLHHHEGPGIEAMSNPDPVVIDDVAADERWQRWRSQVADMGFKSAIALPLGTTRSTLGALNVYSTQPKTFTARASVGRLYARHASVALVAARHELGLRQAIDARHAIGQAQGILMERHGLDADKAFAMLRESARNHNLTLSQRAEQIIASRRTVT